MKWNEGVLVQLRDLAMLGNTAAQYRLGEYYANSDQVKAIDWYRKAAEGGSAPAQVALGDMYANGRGVERDPAIAANWYLKAVEQGDGRAVPALLRTHPSATSPQILDAVLVCCRKAASEGDSGALCWLGIAHEQGIGVEKDSALAARLYHKAAALGDSQARLLLRTMAAHDADAVELAASLDRYTHRPGASESSPREPRPAGDPRGESLRAPRTFGAFMARALGVLFGVVLIAGFVYVMVKLVKWAWFN